MGTHKSLNPGTVIHQDFPIMALEAQGRGRHGQQNRPGNASEQDKSLQVLDARKGIRTLPTWDRSNSVPRVMEFGEAKGGLPLEHPPIIVSDHIFVLRPPPRLREPLG